MAWLALGLVVALVLAWTTRPSSPHSPSEPHSETTTSTVASRTGAGSPARAETSPTATPRETAHLPRHPDREPTAPSTTSPPPATTSTAVHTARKTPAKPATAPRQAPARTTEYSGALSFPADVATTYFPTAAGGEFVVAGSWAPTRTMELSVTCGALTDEAQAAGGATVSLVGAAGPCRLAVAEPAGATWGTSYRLSVRAEPALGRAGQATGT